MIISVLAVYQPQTQHPGRDDYKEAAQDLDWKLRKSQGCPPQ